MRRNKDTGDLDPACLECDLVQRGGDERDKKQVAEMLWKKPPKKA